ncbi:MAG: ABC transporter permease [Solirubrobacterales bacterium]|nr:ABC transporter permease [Solirubrobacterales bacterium]
MTRTTVALGRRALRNSLRRPQFLAPMFIFPTLLLAVNVGGLSATLALPGFPPVRGFLDFQLAAATTQSLLLAGVSVGIATGLEIEGGFFDRLAVSPISRSSIVFGRLAGHAAIASIQVAFFLALGLLFGATIESGFAGVLVVMGIGVIAGVGFGGLGMVLALRSKSTSVVQGIFPLAFVVLFLSSAFFPASQLVEPAKTIAAYNPLSYIADGMRSPMISQMSAEPVLEGFAVAIGLAVVMAALAVSALRTRLADS